MHFRKIRIRLLALQGVFYRLFVTCFEVVFFWILTGELKIALGISVGWNILNICIYYAFHYTWAKTFKLGRD